MDENAFPSNQAFWILGHALGVVTFTPVFSQISGGEFGGWLGNARRSYRAEAFPLSVRNVEDLLLTRGINISHETVVIWSTAETL